MRPAKEPNHDRQDRLSEWGDRLKALGSIQARYTWWMLLVSLFAIALHARLVECGLFSGDPDAINRCSEPIVAPLLGIELSPLVLWAASPSLIALLALTLLGSINAAIEALVKLGGFARWGDSPSGYVDQHPNSIDLAGFVHPMFGRSGSNKLARFIACILRWLSRRKYTAFVSLQLFVASYITWHIFTLRSDRGEQFLGQDAFLVLGSLLILMSLSRLLYMVVLSIWPATADQSDGHGG